MALTFLAKEPLQYFELWEKSPRLPTSVQIALSDMGPNAKILSVINYYVEHEED